MLVIHPCVRVAYVQLNRMSKNQNRFEQCRIGKMPFKNSSPGRYCAEVFELIFERVVLLRLLWIGGKLRMFEIVSIRIMVF